MAAGSGEVSERQFLENFMRGISATLPRAVAREARVAAPLGARLAEKAFLVGLTVPTDRAIALHGAFDVSAGLVAGGTGLSAGLNCKAAASQASTMAYLPQRTPFLRSVLRQGRPGISVFRKQQGNPFLCAAKKGCHFFFP